MKNKYKFFALGLILGLTIMGSISFTVNKDDVQYHKSENQTKQQWYPVKLPKSMSFAGEKVPLNQQPVKEMLEKQLLYNSYAHSHILYILKLSTRVFPIIEPILRQNGIPEDFKFMCVAESSLQNPTSPAGAKGYWQFMEATAKHYGLEVDREVDERYDLVKSTNAACDYIKNAYERLGNWTAAAASYNCGVYGYSKRAKFQMSKDYYDLWLPRETNNYIFRILALKEIISHPAKYGFHVPPEEEYHEIPIRTIVVTESISNLAVFAKQNSTTYKRLHILNPWLRNHTLTISKGNQYVIKLPQ